ncbi:hypothetical protein [Chthonobacter rhizosphaerae]|uniref:hypothetical protein n=1 Tax=Chthonobacter rhizosphaerae TaxID=2735553 RepID=UPI0015EF6462|nr:hypothetical protein [Chthonobacter rhizosphaerae]
MTKVFVIPMTALLVTARLTIGSLIVLALVPVLIVAAPLLVVRHLATRRRPRRLSKRVDLPLASPARPPERSR